MMTDANINPIDYIRDRYKGMLELNLTFRSGVYGCHEYGIIIVEKLVVNKGCRKHGIGTDVMRNVCKFADQTYSIIMLSTTDGLGATSKGRLRKFYRQFGFVSNRGKTKVYSLPLYEMYRIPKQNGGE